MDSYIAIVETYIVNKEIKDDKQKIEAFKANIHPDKGHARSIIKCRHFVEDLNTYQEYLSEFRKHFSRTSDNDPLRILVKYLGMKRKPGEDTTDYITRLDPFSKQVEDNIQGTPWTEANNDTLVPLRMMSKMLMMAQLISDSQGSITEKLYKDLNQNILLSQIDYIIKGYLEKDPQCNQYVLPVRQQSPSPTRQSRSRTPSSQKTYTQRARSSSRPRSSIQCYTCYKVGHLAKDCFSQAICGSCQYQGRIESMCRNPPWCVYHRKVGHKTRDCRRGSTGHDVNFHQAPYQ